MLAASPSAGLGGGGGGLVEPLLQESLPGRRDALQQHRADELVAESEPEAVDAEDAPFAQPLERLDEFGRVDAEEIGERFGLEWLLEDGGGDEDAIRPVALGAALSKQRLGQRLRRAGGVSVCERLGDEAGIAAGGVVQVRDPERG